FCFLTSNFSILILFFFQPTATSSISTLSLHDALPIFVLELFQSEVHDVVVMEFVRRNLIAEFQPDAMQKINLFRREVWRMRLIRSEEHTSELQSRFDLVCRLLLEKKKNSYKNRSIVSN